MLESSVIYVLIRSLPESIILTLSGMILLGVELDKNKIFKYGTLLGLTIAFIRGLPINFGVHTILSMIIFGLMLFYISNKQVINSMIATLGVWIALVLSEGIYVVILTKVFGISFDKLSNNIDPNVAIMTLPSLLIIILLVLLFRKVKHVIDKTILRG